jgi:Domain of unknown function (DUF6438)
MEQHYKKFNDIHYSLTILNDGKVEYVGIRSVRTTETKVSRISERDLNSLIDEFIDIYFLRWKINTKYVKRKMFQLVSCQYHDKII